ncbi:hypothetical protein [Runella sp.]|uniref:hypothetical protein n=1 Tax=Runella sp. TaxID=1960881 RepID=UPI003D1512FD
MILLRNFDYATKFFDYKSKNEINDTSNPKINGWYKFISGILSALLVIENNLYFLYRDEMFLITDLHRVLLKETSKIENKFYLMNGNEVLVKFLYSLPESKLNVPPFEYIDETDFKWGDFIEKIINDRERKRSFIMNLMEGS